MAGQGELLATPGLDLPQAPSTPASHCCCVCAREEGRKFGRYFGSVQG